MALTRLGGFTREGKTPGSELNADSGVEIVNKMKIFKRESPLSRLPGKALGVMFLGETPCSRSGADDVFKVLTSLLVL